jgi:hypothetical protein
MPTSETPAAPRHTEEQIVGILRKRVAECSRLIDESRDAGRRLDAGILLCRREEARAILATVLEIVEANTPRRCVERPAGADGSP